MRRTRSEPGRGNVPAAFLITILAGLFALVLVFIWVRQDRQGERLDDGMARVIRVIDGDTAMVDVAGHQESIRLLGIDTPETHHPSRPVECYGAEASARLDGLIPPGTIIRLERDEEARDHYGRLLAYIYLPGGKNGAEDLNLNLLLVAEGYAVTLPIEPNRAHRQALSAAEQAAKANQLGLWGQCGGPGVAIEPVFTG